MSSSMLRRFSSGSFQPWVKYRIAAASSPLGPPNCCNNVFAKVGFVVSTLTLYIIRLLCRNISDPHCRLGRSTRPPRATPPRPRQPPCSTPTPPPPRSARTHALRSNHPPPQLVIRSSG